jgi:SAM-dependent methyltransferase
MRSFERIFDHYIIEKELAARLRNSSASERRLLYTAVYDELMDRIADHPLHLQKSKSDSLKFVGAAAWLLRNPPGSDAVFLELGPGDCALSLEIAKQVKQVYAVDVSAALAPKTQPANFKLLLSDGSSIPVPLESVDFAYSNQLMEHLHPDDAFEQLRNVYAALAPNGTYLCATPNRLNGPHDVSEFFDNVATGLHLKEYSISELAKLFKDVGFRRVRALVGAKSRYILVPVNSVIFIESVLAWLPRSWRRIRIFRSILGMRLLATKNSPSVALSARHN